MICLRLAGLVTHWADGGLSVYGSKAKGFLNSATRNPLISLVSIFGAKILRTERKVGDDLCAAQTSRRHRRKSIIRRRKHEKQGKRMSLEYIWWNEARPSAVGQGPSSSWQVGTAPASRVYAFTSMQSVESHVFTYRGAAPASGYHDIAVYSGIVSYVKGGLNVPIGQGKKYGVVPAIFDSDVTAVTFAWGVSGSSDIAQPGGGFSVDDYVNADFTFQVFGWE
jgi:hypothetical protein